MSTTWTTDNDAPHLKVGAAGYLRAFVRVLPLVTLIGLGLAALGLIRLGEIIAARSRRPLSPHVTRIVCRGALWLLGIGYRIEGTPSRSAGALVANHSSWLDIFALNAAAPLTFVSKSEVAGWPGIGWLARATGTVFIRRDRREAAAQISVFRDRLAAGETLLFFPEGTSTDGQQVLAFKPTLFASFLHDDLRDQMIVQGVTVNYRAPAGADARFYGWWGDMDLAPHLLATLAARRPGTITLRYADPVPARDYSNRKVLAKVLEDQVRAGLTLHDGAQL